jgi:hypothetical protein
MFHPGIFPETKPMRLTSRVCIGAAVPLLLSSTCLTIDPPLPQRLSPPIFSGVNIHPGYFNGSLQEMITLRWEPDTTDTVSIVSFCILRRTDSDSFPTPVTNIPGTVREIWDPVYLLNMTDRSAEHLVTYRIFGIDSLGRNGDTSGAYIVEIARFVNLLNPADRSVFPDTLRELKFRWEVTPIVNQFNVHVLVWKSDTLVWTSDTIRDYTGGLSKIYERTLPGSVYNFKSGTYFCGVSLTITGGEYENDPSSIRLSSFYVE